MLLLLLHLSDAACSEAHKLLATIKEDLQQTQMQGQEICKVRTIEETGPGEAVTSTIRERFWVPSRVTSGRHISSGTCHN